MSTLLQRIDERCRKLGISRRAASLKSGLGPDAIRDIARGKNASPGLTTIEALAEGLETTVDWLRGEGTNTLGEGVFRPAPVMLGDDDLPLFRSVEGGPGYIVVNSRPDKHIARPKRLKGNEDAFAVVVAGESMSPEYEAGDMIFVDPHKPMVRDRNFIFIDDRHGNWKACVKRLLRWNAETYFVKQHNPPEGQTEEFTLNRADWPKVHRVLGKFDRE